MNVITTARKVLDAALTALAVVFGLQRDPSALPVLIRIDER